MAIGAGGKRKSSSMVLRMVESESRERTRVYCVWLKASSLVKDSAHVAAYFPKIRCLSTAAME